MVKELFFAYNSSMGYIYFNNNPLGKHIGDCVIRAISKATDSSWDDIYMDLVSYGYRMGDMPSSNSVWGQYLIDEGFTRMVIPNTCPDCYTIRQFLSDHPQGTFILATGSHVVTAIDGNIYDSWNSLSEIPIYFYWR